MKAHYIFTTNTEKAKINKIIKDKLTEFSTWIDDNEPCLFNIIVLLLVSKSNAALNSVSLNTMPEYT